MDTSRKHLETIDNLANIIAFGPNYGHLRTEFSGRSGFREECPLGHVMIGGKNQMGPHITIRGDRNIPPIKMKIDPMTLKVTYE